MNSSFILPLLALTACGCAAPPLTLDPVHTPQELNIPKATPAVPAPPRPFVRLQSPGAKNAELPITLNLTAATLSECLTLADSTLTVVPTTPEINLNRHCSVRVNNLSLQQYLGILEGITGYALELDPDYPIVHVSSYRTNSWDVSTFAAHGQARVQVGQAVSLSSSTASGEEGENSDKEEDSSANSIVTFDHMDSPWDDLLVNARAILGLDATTASAGADTSRKRADLAGGRPATWPVARTGACCADAGTGYLAH